MVRSLAWAAPHNIKVAAATASGLKYGNDLFICFLLSSLWIAPVVVVLRPSGALRARLALNPLAARLQQLDHREQRDRDHDKDGCDRYDGRFEEIAKPREELSRQGELGRPGDKQRDHDLV